MEGRKRVLINVWICFPQKELSAAVAFAVTLMFSQKNQSHNAVRITLRAAKNIAMYFKSCSLASSQWLDVQRLFPNHKNVIAVYSQHCLQTSRTGDLQGFRSHPGSTHLNQMILLFITRPLENFKTC